MLLLIVAGLSALGGKTDERNDSVALTQYVFLVAVLSAMATIHVPQPVP